MSSARQRAAAVSVVSNASLVVLKLLVGSITGSVSIVSKAIHSANDLLASAIALFSVRTSDKEADEDHPYGHGKIEGVSGGIEAFLIIVAEVWIVHEAVQRILHGGRQPVRLALPVQGRACRGFHRARGPAPGAAPAGRGEGRLGGSPARSRIDP